MDLIPWFDTALDINVMNAALGAPAGTPLRYVLSGSPVHTFNSLNILHSIPTGDVRP
jgi:hypothetical protein